MGSTSQRVAEVYLPGGWLEYRRFAAGVVLRVLGVGVSVISAVVTARGLGVSGRGLLYTCTSASTLGAQVFALGMPSAAVLAVASRPALGRRAIRYALAASLGAWLAAALAGLVMDQLGASRWLPSAVAELGMLVAGLMGTQILLAWCSSLTQALGATDRIPAIELIYRSATVTWAWIALFPLQFSFRYFLGSLIVVDFIYGSLWLTYVRTLIPHVSEMPHWPREWRKWSVKAFFPLLLENLLRRIDVLVLTSLAGVRATGLYSVATQVMDVSQIGSVFLGQKAMYSFSAGHGDSLSIKWLRRALPVAAMAAMIAAGLTAEIWAPVLLGAQFSGTGPIVLALSFGAAALAWETVAVKEIAAAGFPIQLSMSWLVVCCAAVALMFVFIPRLGPVGAGIAMSLSYFVLALLVYGIRSRIRGANSRRLDNRL